MELPADLPIPQVVDEVVEVAQYVLQEPVAQAEDGAFHKSDPQHSVVGASTCRGSGLRMQALRGLDGARAKPSCEDPG